jgi:hypothetical protein
MRIFRTILDTDLGDFLVDAIHNDSKVQLMSVRQIDEDGIVRERFPLPMSQLPLVVEQIEHALRDCGEIE